MKRSNDIYSKVSYLLYSNSIESKLQERYRNTIDENYIVDVKTIKEVMNLDEYFYRLMNENASNTIGSALNRYLTVISNQIEREPLLLLSLPMYKLNSNKLRSYLPNYDRTITRIKQKESYVNTIYRKLVNNPRNLSDRELYELVSFLNYTMPYADERMQRAQEQVAIYILNNLKDTVYNYHIATYLVKFFGYRKIRKENLTDTRIIIAGLDEGTYGESEYIYAAVNKKLLQKVLMENNTLDDRFGNKTIPYSLNVNQKSGKYHEIFGILHTTYHEIRHQKQRNQSENGVKDDLSYYFAAFEIINENNRFDYKTNYKFYEIEKDANYKAWEDVEVLLRTYMPNQNTDRLRRRILGYKLNEDLEQIAGTRKNQNNQKYISNDLLMEYLDRKFRNNPYLVTQKYPQFLNFYNANGTPKRVIELLKQPGIYNYKEFYCGYVSYHSRMIGYQLTMQDLRTLTMPEIQTVINNIKILMNNTQEKINKICDRVDNYNKSSEATIGNLSNYRSFARKLSTTMNEILNMYPILISQLPVRNAIASINENIDRINNKKRLGEIMNDQLKISRIGRR